MNEILGFAPTIGPLHHEAPGQVSLTLAQQHLNFADRMHGAMMMLLLANAAHSQARHAMQTRPDLTVLGFLDGCCQQTSNINPFIAAVNTMLPPSWSPIDPVYIDRNVASPQNSASTYALQFAALPEMRGGYYSSLRSVPTPYALYLDPAAPPTPPPAEARRDI